MTGGPTIDFASAVLEPRFCQASVGDRETKRVSRYPRKCLVFSFWLSHNRFVNCSHKRLYELSVNESANRWHTAATSLLHLVNMAGAIFHKACLLNFEPNFRVLGFEVRSSWYAVYRGHSRTRVCSRVTCSRHSRCPYLYTYLWSRQFLAVLL